ncbi:L,D-transpeptidase family protein [Novosphingobium panipatense]|uniref:L,D-transpeptidase catalytic domain n=1 Tax=Novosphingobium panipatense TaxID=428991 RepID=A0ABY1QBE0_9SPHN|nr:L,D-transpeptidase family protein [Novosphingobium panipatense]SMP61812.1 L,D-transpeptidase catalytic domain [Novosphingobium panipatense]
MNARLFLASGFIAAATIAAVLFASASSGSSEQAPPFAPSAPRQQAAPTPQFAPAPAPAEEEPFVIKRVLPIKGPIRYGEWHWNDADAPDGPIVLTVDLDARVISVFRGGYEIGAAAVLLGTDEKPTPLGVFPITEKDRDHVSNIYTGAPMPFMQRLTNDGISLHGSDVALGYASHGCVGMPNAFAAKVFDTTKLGDKVYITRGKRITVGDNLLGG